MAFKTPTFQDRAALAAEAKAKALEKLKTVKPVDPAIAAERQAKLEAREAAEREKSAARRAEREAVKQAKLDRIAAEEAAVAAAAAEAAAKIEAARLKIPTPAEMKAARDARYAARKARK